MIKFIKRILITALLTVPSCQPALASHVDSYLDYSAGSTVTGTNLQGNFDNIRAGVNGDLDNDNAAVNRGFRFYEILGTLPAAGTRGRVIFLTSNNLLYFDDGTQFLPFLNVAGTPVAGDIVYWNGTNWIKNGGTHAQGDILYYSSGAWLQLPKSTSSTRSLTNTGTSNNPAWAQVSLTSGVSGVLPIANMTPMVEIFTSNGTFTAPTGITKVYLTMVGGGGGGVPGLVANYGGGGGGGGGAIINRQYTVVAGNPYAVVVGAGGASNAAGNNSTFDSTVIALGGNTGSTSTGAVAIGGFTGAAGSGSTPGSGGANNIAGGAGGNGVSGTAKAGGGGGGTPFGSGGAGGITTAGVAGTANTGAGGGGGGNQDDSHAGGAGGSGIVIVMY